MDRELSQDLKNLLRQAGAALVGYGGLSGVEGCPWPVGVSVALPVPPAILEQIRDGPTRGYWEMYHAWNARLDDIVTQGAAFLEERGWRALAQTTRVVRKDENWCTPLPHKTVATRAGLGWIGKNCLLVTPEYGPAVRISSLLTDAPLPLGTPEDESRCGSCQACQRACPGQAIKGQLWRLGMAREELLDKAACKKAQTEWMKARTGIETDLCGQCFVVCPYTIGYLRRAGGGLPRP